MTAITTPAMVNFQSNRPYSAAALVHSCECSTTASASSIDASVHEFVRQQVRERSGEEPRAHHQTGDLAHPQLRHRRQAEVTWAEFPDPVQEKMEKMGPRPINPETPVDDRLSPHTTRQRTAPAGAVSFARLAVGAT
jgi:hypothetical protein